MADLDGLLIEQAKHLDKLSTFMKTKGAGLTQKEATEISDIIKQNANTLRALAKKV